MPGTHWLVEAYGCTPAALSDPSRLSALLESIVADLALTPVGEAHWHRFPDPGGVTGLLMLAESHLSVHTWPEHGSLCLDLFCCHPRPAWDFEGRLAEALGAERVSVRVVERDYAPAARGMAGMAGMPGVARVAGELDDGVLPDPSPAAPEAPAGYTPSRAGSEARLRP